MATIQTIHISDERESLSVLEIPRTFLIFEAKFLSLPAFPALPKTRSKRRLSNASPASPQSRQTEFRG